MELRKVQVMGGGTALVSLPKQWVKRNKVERGTILSIDDQSGDTLTIYPFVDNKTDVKEVEVDYPTEYMENLINSITGAYLLGYDVIRIKGKHRMKFEDREKIKDATRQLVGLEILEEDAQSITTQFLLGDTILGPEKILRRMHMIVREMYKDALTALLESDEHLVKVAAQRDDEVDRLYFLLVRLIRSSALDAKLAAKYGLTAISCLDYRVAANIIESIGDAAVKIACSVGTIMKMDLDNAARSGLHDVSEALEKMQDQAIMSFLSRSAEGARKAIREHQVLTEKLKHLEDLFLHRPAEVVREMWTILAAFYEVGKSSADIADLTFPLYPMVK